MGLHLVQDPGVLFRTIFQLLGGYLRKSKNGIIRRERGEPMTS